MKKLLLGLILALTACQMPAPPSPQLEAKKVELRKIAASEKAKGDYSAGSTLESQIVSLDNNEPDSFVNLSQTLYKQGFKPEGQDILVLGEKLLPESEKIRLYVAMGLVDNNHPDEAIAKLNTIKTLKTKDYYNALGVANDLEGKHDVAQSTFKEGLKTAPNDDLLRNNLALSYILSRNYSKAISILKELVDGPNTKPKYRHNLALAYGMSGKYDEASKVLAKDLNKKQIDENIKSYKKMRTSSSE